MWAAALTGKPPLRDAPTHLLVTLMFGHPCLTSFAYIPQSISYDILGLCTRDSQHLNRCSERFNHVQVIITLTHSATSLQQRDHVVEPICDVVHLLCTSTHVSTRFCRLLA